jgi:ferredoxin
MATISVDGIERELADGAAILEACEELGVPFSCQAGECATCLVMVLEGAENLAPKNYTEQIMGLRHNERLACQAKIISGRVVLTY